MTWTFKRFESSQGSRERLGNVERRFATPTRINSHNTRDPQGLTAPVILFDDFGQTV